MAHILERVLENEITLEYGLKTEGLVGFDKVLNPGGSAQGRKKRRHVDLERGQDATLAYDQWDVSDSIGGDLYTTASVDSLWERPYTLEFVADNETLVKTVFGHCSGRRHNQ